MRVLGSTLVSARIVDFGAGDNKLHSNSLAALVLDQRAGHLSEVGVFTIAEKKKLLLVSFYWDISHK